MNYPLAILTPALGVLTETFIRRHVQDLLPGRTAVIAYTKQNDEQLSNWNAYGPTLFLEGLNRTWEGGIRWVIRKGGIPVAEMFVIGFERFLKKHKVQVILGEYLHSLLPFFPAIERLGIRFYGHAHGYDVSWNLTQPKWQKEYLRYNESNGIITMNQVSRKRLIDLGIKGSKIHVVPYGVEVPQSAKKRPVAGQVRCLVVGRMVSKKSPILTLDAFRRASQVMPNLRLDYIGQGELLPAAQQFVRAFGLEEKVALHKGQPHEIVQRFMSRSDIFLQHSMTDPETGDEEGMPVSILEAMAHSLPVISTRHAGIPEAVMEGITGCLVNEGDNITMADRICALAVDHDLRQQMGVAGWERVKENFTWERERSSLLNVMGL